jgi:hypothetical protein
VAAKNGLFIRKKMRWVDAVVKVRSEDLVDEKMSAQLLLPPLPASILAQSLKLAKVVFDVSKSEVCLLLHFHEATGYHLTVPLQEVDPGHVHYDASMHLPDMMCVGTIHSHGALRAYHSNTDFVDERFTDGVHITLGCLHRYPKFTMSAEMAVNGFRFPVDPSWFEGLKTLGDSYYLEDAVLESTEIPTSWLTAIDHRHYENKSNRPRRNRKSSGYAFMQTP